MNYHKVVYCLLQKIYTQSLTKIIYVTTRHRFLAQGQGQGLGGKAKAKASGYMAKAVSLKAKAKKFGLKA